MRLVIISDIHGNLPALEAVLRELEAEPPDQFICLGDVAATGPQPDEVLAQLRSLDCPVVLGNTDAYLLDPQPTQGAEEDVRKVEEIDRWCATQLSPANLQYLGTFRPTITVHLEEGSRLLCYHGSPRSYHEVIAATTPDEDLLPMFGDKQATVMAGGHWHFQMLRRYGAGILLNPGSVGLTYDILPSGSVRVPARAEYALLTSDDGALRIELRRVPYEQGATVRAMFDRGMPHAGWWSAGWDNRT